MTVILNSIRITACFNLYQRRYKYGLLFTDWKYCRYSTRLYFPPCFQSIISAEVQTITYGPLLSPKNTITGISIRESTFTMSKVNIMKSKIIFSVLVGGLIAIASPAFAEHGDRHFEGREFHRGGEGWHGGRHTVEIWRGGNWVHERHDGRFGWWWVAAGMWYFYPSPVYPYPDPYTPPVVVVNQQPPAAPQTNVPAQPPLQYWYYCDSAKAYYPYVPSCPEAWRTVPAQPPVPALTSQAPQQAPH